MCVFADVLQAGAHEGKRFVLWPFFYLKNFFDSLLIKHVAPNTVAGISGIAHDGPEPQLLHDLVDKTLLWIIRVD